MNIRMIAALLCTGAASLGLQPASARSTTVSITIPLRFGERHVAEPARSPSPAAPRLERRLRLARYGLQLADAIVSAIGYHAYARCLSCLAYPGGGPAGSVPLSVAGLSGNRPAETDPLIQPFSRGGMVSLSLGAFAYDLIDARIERRWSIERRIAADVSEIGAHAWGISTWLPELTTISRDSAIAAACGRQWASKAYGQAFSDGCVNEYYRTAPGSAAPPPLSAGIDFVCAPARFGRGTYLFATATTNVVSSGSPCPLQPSPFP